MSMFQIDDHSDNQSTANSQTVRLDRSNQCVQEAVRRGQHAWARFRGDHTWGDWLLVGAALGILRTEAMRKARVNEPVGRIYNEAFGALLDKFGFENIDKGDRARLFEVMDKLVEIERWRATLTENQRLVLNHPTSVLRKWKTATVVSPQDPRKASPVAKLKQSIVALSEENHRLKREVDAGGGDLWTCNDEAEEIAAVMLAKLSPTKAKRVAETILRQVEKQ
jgi:hypothetical protein